MKRILLFSLLSVIIVPVMAQTDKWTGSWQVISKPWPHIPAVIMDLQIGAPEQGVLYPAKIKLQYGQFTGVYEMLLVRKNDRQLGISRGKYPLQETPYKLGIWMWYLNGTLDYKDGKMYLNRMWEDQFGIWMRGLYEDGELWVNSKVMLRDFLYRDSMTFKRTGSKPLADSSVRRILQPETSGIYLGIYDPITATDSVIIMQVEDEEKYDRDTVTLLQNTRPIFSREEINDNNRRQQIRLDTGRNFFVFFADNYGGLPPNTGALYAKVDGKEYMFDFTHRANAFATFMVADIRHHRIDSSRLSTQASGRAITPVATIAVDTADITLELWDEQVEDNDSISLSLNGKWIATGFPVKKGLQQIQVKLQRGENTLLFMADNLGKIPPNTAVLRICFRDKSRTLGLRTDMKKNNEIKLVWE